MVDTLEYITLLQIKLFGEISREVEHGATQQEVFDAISLTITNKLNVPCSPAWVQTFAKRPAHTLLHGSIARTHALQNMLDQKMSIWDGVLSAAHGSEEP